jgi:hypothetical protein
MRNSMPQLVRRLRLVSIAADLMVALTEARGTLDASRRLPPKFSLRKITSRYLFGVILLFFVVILWTVSNFITQVRMAIPYTKPVRMP